MKAIGSKRKTAVVTSESNPFERREGFTVVIELSEVDDGHKDCENLCTTGDI